MKKELKSKNSFSHLNLSRKIWKWAHLTDITFIKSTKYMPIHLKKMNGVHLSAAVGISQVFIGATFP